MSHVKDFLGDNRVEIPLITIPAEGDEERKITLIKLFP